ncbi:MAG: histidine phosphatase family protein [Terriglobales bacterium]
MRHGESERNVALREALERGALEYGSPIRQADTPLTDRGWQQAEHTGRSLGAHFRFHRVIASPYMRTLQTAQAIIKTLPYKGELRVDERIRERESGILDGLTRTGIKQKYPEELARAEREGRYYYRPPGGESHPDVNLRVQGFLTSLRQNFAGHSILVVSHSIVIWAFRRLLDRLTEQELLELLAKPDLDVRNCSVTRYALNGGALRPKLVEFNAVYYPPELDSPGRDRQPASAAG